MEEELSAAATAAVDRSRPGCRATVIRAGDFFGSGTGSWFDLVIAKDMHKGTVTYPGRFLDVPHAWAYLPDLAKAFVAVAMLPNNATRPSLECLHFAGHTATGAELFSALEAAGDALRVRAPSPSTAAWTHATVPWWLFRILGLCDPMMPELLEMRYLWDTPHALDGSSMRETLGYKLQTTPFRDAVLATVTALGLGHH